ncbi:MAG: hypothetical protein A2583_11600 [Bdellovibrionales bacterium RIFOXYD1_FULL_53_11]|nr:MAG: hypothetical protein A2583_11600 [Bdellovibrionales bacterium RIFOXYD1_FULL_53_11]
MGRKEEIRQLQLLRRDKEAKIAVLYGRRRVGKTSLIKEAFLRDSVLFFEGIENQNPKKQIMNFLFQLKQQSQDQNIDFEVKDWKNALIQLKPILNKKPFVIVLDEFQWMASYRDNLVAELKMVWEQYLSKFPGTTLVLCGSIASFMTRKVIKSKALYGRVDLEINLEPFKLKDAAELLCGHGKIETIEAVLLLGGIPLYLNLVKNYTSLYAGINETAFKKNGFFINEYERIFISHFGKRDVYSKIIKLLAKYEAGLFREDMARLSGVDLSGHLSVDLFDLESAGFIKSYFPVDKAPESKIKKFVLTDPFMKFYHKFIASNLKSILINKKDVFTGLAQTPAFYSFLGRSFETLCMNHLLEISKILGFNGINFSCGPYFRKNSSQKGLQIDLLFDRSDNVMTVCEMKYKKKPVGIEVVRELENKIDILKTKTNKTIQKVLIVKDEVTDDLIKSGYFYKIITSHELFI